MKNWETRRLGDVVDHRLGKMLDAQKNKGEYLPYLGNINVRWGAFDLENLGEMRFELHELERYCLKDGDIVMCEGGEPGRCAIWKDEKPGMMIQKALHRIRPHSCLDNRFLYYTFLHMGRTGGFASLFTGATIQHLPGQNLGKVEIKIPPLSTQRLIVAILSAYDDLIENNRRRIQLLEQAGRLIYREWFVRLRFPGHERVRVVDGVPEGWEKTRLGRVAAVNQEQLKSSHRGVIEYVDISSVSPGSIDATQSFEFEMAPGRARRIVRHGDIIWSCVRPNRRSHAIIWNPPPNLIASTGFAVITPRQVPTSYLYYALTTDSFVGYLTNRARGGAYPAVLASDFEDAELLRPDKTLVGEFDRLVCPMIDQRANLRLQNEHLGQARDLLLPKLMSGEIEV